MQFEDVAAACLLVQAVNVLGDDRDLGYQVLQSGNGDMTGIRIGLFNKLRTMNVSVPDQLGVVAEGFGAGNLGRIEFGP